jgi:hypothetical protein
MNNNFFFMITNYTAQAQAESKAWVCEHRGKTEIQSSLRMM